MGPLPGWTALAAAAALIASSLLVAIKPVRAGTALRAALLHALALGLAAPVVALGVVLACEVQVGSLPGTPGRLGLLAFGGLASLLCALVVIGDVATLVRTHRAARLARAARSPSGPIPAESRPFDFGIGEGVTVLEQAPDAPYRAAARVEHAFFGSASRALGTMRRAWALEALAALTIAGATVIASRERPLAEPIVAQDPPRPVPPEPTIVNVWSAPASGDARLAGADRGHVMVTLSDSHPAEWSLRTIDLATGAETERWDASPAAAKLWTGLHTSDGFHAVDHDLEHDLVRYAAVVTSTGRRDSRLAASSHALVFARRDSEDEPTRLWMADRDGKRSWRLDKTHAGSASAAFSRDGKRLAWVAWTERVAGEGYSVVEARADGTAQREAIKAGSFGWRADGHLVAHTMDHERECIVDADGGANGLHRCIAGAHLGTVFWDERGESAAWVGFVEGSLAYEWIRLATGEVLAHGALAGANAYGDVILDAGERPALFVVAGRGSPTTFVLERVDLRSGETTATLSGYVPGASGLGTMVEAEDGSLILTQRELGPEPKVRIVRVFPAALRRPGAK